MQHLQGDLGATTVGFPLLLLVLRGFWTIVHLLRQLHLKTPEHSKRGPLRQSCTDTVEATNAGIEATVSTGKRCFICVEDREGSIRIDWNKGASETVRVIQRKSGNREQGLPPAADAVAAAAHGVRPASRLSALPLPPDPLVLGVDGEAEPSPTAPAAAAHLLLLPAEPK